MEHISKLGEAIANTVSAGQSGDGAELVKSTATKYTLIGKISVDDGSQRCVSMADDF